MAEEPNDQKKNGEGTPSGADQPEKKTTTDSEGASGATGATGASGPEEKVEVSKSELEKLRKDAALTDNYRGAVIRLNKERGRSLPGSEPEKKPKSKSEEDDDWGDGDDKQPKGDFVTKKELAQRDEKAAINKACENEEIALNWDEVVGFYIPPKDTSYEAKLEAINKAHKLWRADKGLTDNKPDDEKGKKDTQDLATDKGLNKGKEKKPVQEKKHIIPPKTSMDKWY
jgi:hypothetical protein